MHGQQNIKITTKILISMLHIHHSLSTQPPQSMCLIEHCRRQFAISRWNSLQINIFLNSRYLPVWILTGMNTYRYEYLPVWIFTGMNTYRYESLPVWILTGMNTYRYEYLPVWIFTGMNTYRYESLPVWILTGMNTYRYEYLPVWIFTCMNTYRYESLPVWLLTGMNPVRLHLSYHQWLFSSTLKFCISCYNSR